MLEENDKRHVMQMFMQCKIWIQKSTSTSIKIQIIQNIIRNIWRIMQISIHSLVIFRRNITFIAMI